MSDLQRPGGWSAFSCDISKEAREAFDEAMAGFIGVRYSPVAVAQQVVAGTNYAFFCNTVSSTNPPQRSVAIVEVFQPLPGQGPAQRTGIVPSNWPA